MRKTCRKKRERKCDYEGEVDAGCAHLELVVRRGLWDGVGCAVGDRVWT